MTYESDADGVLIEVFAQEGDTLPVGQLIARVGTADELGAGKSQRASAGDGGQAAESSQGPASEPEAQPARAEAPPAGDPRPVASSGNSRVNASPVARRMAREMGVELAGIRGTGPDGRIVKADVAAAAHGGGVQVQPRPAERAAPGEAPNPHFLPPASGLQSFDGVKGEVRIQELTRLQRVVSRRMAESKATAPEFQLHAEIDVSACVDLRARLKDIADPPPSFNDMVVKAAANALREFTVSNLGMYGIESFSAVINPPQAAILAVGALKKKPVVDDTGAIVARDMMSVTLTCDHRILYGADGAEYLTRVRQLLEQPLSLML
jgi:pyruvate dehydrogenase E2 component (dihydrolipoamide acetyltransferase)